MFNALNLSFCKSILEVYVFLVYTTLNSWAHLFKTTHIFWGQKKKRKRRKNGNAFAYNMFENLTFIYETLNFQTYCMQKHCHFYFFFFFLPKKKCGQLLHALSFFQQKILISTPDFILEDLLNHRIKTSKPR